MKVIISSFFSITSSIIFFLFGNIDLTIKCLLTMMILDYITGLTKGYIKKEISSKTGLRGILKKFLYLVIVASSVILDKLLNLNYSIRDVVALSFVFNEIISIIENCNEIGIKIPDAFTSPLDAFNKKIQESTKDNENKKN